MTPKICEGCLTGEMKLVWVSGLERLDASPCDQMFERATIERRDYCYEQWREKYPDRAAALDATRAEIFRQATRHK